MSPKRFPIVLPDLGLGDREITLTVWHARKGRLVEVGSPLIEIVAGEVAIDLPAPASGTLYEKLVLEDETVHSGQILGSILYKPDGD